MAESPKPTPTAPPHSIDDAISRDDALALARAASSDELDRLKGAEEYLDKRRVRLARTRFALASQALIGYVALAGLVVNAYQSYINKQQQERARATDIERWSKEFDRAQQADKYRAFFETSVLATDTNNADKRLVGYALLEEFVADKGYNSKATLMLEQSLVQELGHSESSGNAIEAILGALAQTSDCHALERAAASIDRIALHHVTSRRSDETELFVLYVRKLLGRAALVCGTLKDFSAVRAPLVAVLTKFPELGNAKGRLTPEAAHAHLAQLLRDVCAGEMTVAGTSDCPRVFAAYVRLCEKASARERRDEEKGCEVMRQAAREEPVPVSSTADRGGE